MNADRLKHAANVGFTPIDLTKSDNLGDLIEAVVGKPEVGIPITVRDEDARVMFAGTPYCL